MFSVIIPAHNESSVIERCLSLLTQGADELEEQDCPEIIVVCNGCRDDTAEKARSFVTRYPKLMVVDVETASKVVALNLGDANANYFPRVYLDADIALSLQDLIGTVRLINEDPRTLVAAPKLEVDLSRSNIWVQSFYRVWMQLPYFSTGQMVGSGVFILSENGRKRFDTFPNIISDDGYVRSLFKENERKMISEYRFHIFAPTTLKDLIKIKTRVRFGNMEIAKKYPSMKIGRDNRLSDIFKIAVKKPWLIGQCIIYVYVQLRTKTLSKQRMAAADFTTWERDESSRSHLK